MWSDAAEADALCVSLQSFADRLALPTAAAADALIREEGWKKLGYARQSDYTRERLDRTSRWLRQLAALGRAVARCPRLAEAVTGDDGKAPIGMVKALALAGVTTLDGVDTWIARAREVGVRQFDRDVREARVALRAAASSSRSRTLGDPDKTLQEDGRADDEPRACARISMPRPVRVAFDEALDLHRAVSGGEASIASFVEALVAEFRAGADAGSGQDAGERNGDGFDQVRVTAAARAARETRGERELRLERDHRQVEDRRDPGLHSLGEARALLGRAARLFAVAGRGDAARLDEQLRALVKIEDELRRTLARLLLAMQDWRLFTGRSGESALPFGSVGHYARARLGLSRATAERLVRLARGLRRHEGLARAYDEGRVTSTEASLVLRALGRAGAEDSAEEAWIERAERATVRRLRDEVRLTVRDSPLAARDGGPQPPNDATWYGSLRRQPGRSFERVVLLGAEACRPQQSWTGLFLRLPGLLADDFRATVDAACRAIARDRRAERGSAAPTSHESLSDTRGSEVALPVGVASWEGLMRLLLGFAAAHDPPHEFVRRRKREIYERDGYRCTAPGCTSRANLEDHHVQYRAHGGGDELFNRVTLCRFHHQRGEHGGLISVRGRAPLDLVFRLGRGRAARRYRNDLTTRRSASSSARPAWGPPRR